MKTLFQNYLNTFKGLSQEVWWLALITLINRSGTMVIPFLSLYLTEDLKFSLSHVGTVMVCFGLGSVIGSWLGGKLTDTIGYYKVMLRSLLCTGFLFIVLQFLKSFYSFCFGIFIVMVVADMFRPAMFVALSAYSSEKNKTRSITLIRLAINLGFSAGPALGGLIITFLSYKGLFWVDGITCILATVLMLLVLNPKKAKTIDSTTVAQPQSAYKDYLFLVFVCAMFLFGFVFLQFLSTIPLFYSTIHKLTELEIGLLIGLNGLLIFTLEMPLISWLEQKQHTKIRLVLLGAALTAISYLLFNSTNWSGILLINMVFITVGEMIAFPFSNAFAYERAKKGNQGEYMALYAIAFSLSHIFCHKAGMQMIANLGFHITWYIIALIGLICVFLLLYLDLTLKSKRKNYL